MVSFYSCNPDTSSDCFVCFDVLQTDVVCHTGDGYTHPVHRKCIQAWAKINQRCPVCTSSIELNSLLTSKERCIILLTAAVGKVLEVGIGILASAAMLGVALLIIFIAALALLGTVAIIYEGGDLAMTVMIDLAAMSVGLILALKMAPRFCELLLRRH